MFSINVVFVDRKTIQALNKKYRQADKTTAVLSFYYGLVDSPAGEILICPETAKKKKLKIEELIIHGFKNILSEIPAPEAARIGTARNSRGFAKNC